MRPTGSAAELERRRIRAVELIWPTGAAQAYNLANFLRQLVLPKPIKGWTPTTLREKFSQDRGQGGVARQVPGLPTSGSSGAPPTVRGHRGADRPASAGVCLGVRRAVIDKTVCVSPPCVQSALLGPSSEDEQGTSVLRGESRQRRNGWRQRFWGKPSQSHLRGVKIYRWRRNPVPGEGHLRKIGYSTGKEGTSSGTRPCCLVGLRRHPRRPP
jgi:hypothetical protein